MAWLDNLWVWQGLCAVLVLGLVINLLTHHRGRMKQWREKQVKKALKHSGIPHYQEQLKLQARHTDLQRAPHDISGIEVDEGLKNGIRSNGSEEVVGELDDQASLSYREYEADNIISIDTARAKPMVRDDDRDYGWEDYKMGKPTERELDSALHYAAQLRETGGDDNYVGKCLLNLNYRNKLLEDVLKHADAYVRNGNDPQQHTLLKKAIEQARQAGESVKTQGPGDSGTFMLS